LRMVGPVFVTAEAPKTAKLAAAPNDGATALGALRARLGVARGARLGVTRSVGLDVA
jgi:hypothetical protein